MSNRSIKFHKDLISSFLITPTERQTDTRENITSLALLRR